MVHNFSYRLHRQEESKEEGEYDEYLPFQILSSDYIEQHETDVTVDQLRQKIRNLVDTSKEVENEDDGSEERDVFEAIHVYAFLARECAERGCLVDYWYS